MKKKLLFTFLINLFTLSASQKEETINGLSLFDSVICQMTKHATICTGFITPNAYIKCIKDRRTKKTYCRYIGSKEPIYICRKGQQQEELFKMIEDEFNKSKQSS